MVMWRMIQHSTFWKGVDDVVLLLEEAAAAAVAQTSLEEVALSAELGEAEPSVLLGAALPSAVVSSNIRRCCTSRGKLAKSSRRFLIMRRQGSEAAAAVAVDACCFWDSILFLLLFLLLLLMRLKVRRMIPCLLIVLAVVWRESVGSFSKDDNMGVESFCWILVAQARCAVFTYCTFLYYYYSPRLDSSPLPVSVYRQQCPALWLLAAVQQQ